MLQTDYPNGEFLHIDWHSSGGFSSAATLARFNYYPSISGVPDTYFDGGDNVVGAGDSVGTYNTYKPILDTHLMDPALSKLIVDAHVDFNSNTMMGSLTIDVEVAPGETIGNPQNCTIRAALHESDLFAPSEPVTGNTRWDYVARQLITETAVTFAGNSGDTQQVTVPFALDPAWNVNNLGVIAWVQRDTNRKVLQAGEAVAAFALSTAELSPPVVKTTGSAGTYSVDVTYDGVVSDDVTVTIDKTALPAGWDAEVEHNATTNPTSITIAGMTQGQTETVIIRTFPGAGAGLGTVDVRIEPASNPSVGETKVNHTFNNTPSVLFVDDDNGDTFETQFDAAIATAGYFRVSTNVQTNGNPETAEMANYDVVVWNTGQVNGGTIGPNVQTKIQAYLDGGGSFFFTSDGYGNHQGVTGFTSNYLGVSAFTLDGLAASATGVASDVIGDGLSFVLSPPFADGADHLTAGLGTVWLEAPGSQPIGMRYDSGTFRTVFLSAPFEGIPTPDQAVVMDRVLEWLGGASGAVGVSPLASGAVEDLELRQNSPNPFRNSTTLRFAVPNSGPVNLTVFDVSGRRVAELVNGDVEAGEYTATWDGRNASGGRVASGVYLVRLETADRAATREMVLLK